MNFDVYPTIGGWGHRHNSKTRSLPVIGLNLDVHLGLFLPLFRSAMAIFYFNTIVEIERWNIICIQSNSPQSYLLGLKLS